MLIFHSYVSLPEGTFILEMFQQATVDCRRVRLSWCPKVQMIPVPGMVGICGNPWQSISWMTQNQWGLWYSNFFQETNSSNCFIGFLSFELNVVVFLGGIFGSGPPTNRRRGFLQVWVRWPLQPVLPTSALGWMSGWAWGDGGMGWWPLFFTGNPGKHHETPVGRVKFGRSSRRENVFPGRRVTMELAPLAIRISEITTGWWLEHVRTAWPFMFHPVCGAWSP